jgi:radical SAM protein with 4Fe4S-binding SPASM domain
MTMELSSYTEFSEKLHHAVISRSIPVNGTIEVSNRCPLNCSHCYNNLAMGDSSARSMELTTDQHRRIADEVVEMGCLWMLYTGGEIFARRDFLDIYRHAKRAGLLITLFTNGVLINEEIADTLVEWRPFAIEITLYGRTRQTYETLTRIPGSFDKCMRGIELLLERGLPLKLKSVGVSVNKHEIMAMKQFANELGVEFKFDSMINPRIDCSSSPLAVRLSPADIVALDFEDPRRIPEYQRLAFDFPAPKFAEGETPQIYACGAGINSFAIDPYGQLSLCVISHFDKYDLKTGSFREGWDFLRKVRRKQATMPTKCTSCALRSMCGMCPAEGELENGHPEKPVDFLCATAHLRARAFDIAVQPHGECEYCEGGEKHESIESMFEEVQERRARMSDPVPVPMMIPETLPATQGCGSGGCTSCSVR